MNVLKNTQIDLDDRTKEIVENKKFLLSIGRFTKQKNFLFYLKCIPEIINLDRDLYFLFMYHFSCNSFKISEVFRKVKTTWFWITVEFSLIN